MRKTAIRWIGCALSVDIARCKRFPKEALASDEVKAADLEATPIGLALHSRH